MARWPEAIDPKLVEILFECRAWRTAAFLVLNRLDFLQCFDEAINRRNNTRSKLLVAF
jgi:hypothetical protein